MKKIKLLSILVSCLLCVFYSCEKDDDKAGNQTYLHPLNEIRVMTYSKSGTVDTTCTEYSVYKFAPLSVNANQQKEYEIRHFSVSEDKHFKWDFDYLANYELDMSMGESDIISVDYEYFMLRGYELKHEQSHQGKVNYDANGRIEFATCHSSESDANSSVVFYEYDEEGHLNHIKEMNGAYGSSKTFSETAFTWKDGNIISILHTDYSELNGSTQKTVSKIEATYSKGVEDSRSLLPFICDKMCGVRLMHTFDYDDYFLGKYGISAKNVITKISVTSYKQQEDNPGANLDETDAVHKTYEVTPRIGKDKVISDYSVTDPDNKPYHTVFCYVRK